MHSGLLGAIRRGLTTHIGRSLAIAALATQPACGLFASSGPSLVGQGKYYSSVNARYDRFFLDLYDLQLEMAQAPSQAQDVRVTLTASLGYPKRSDQAADQAAADQVLLEKLKQDAKRYASGGLLLLPQLEKRDPSCVAPDKPAETAIMRTSGTAAGPQAGFVSAVEIAANSLVALRHRMRGTQQRLDKLRATAIALENAVGEEFRIEGPGKRDEVSKNLADAERLIPLMSSRARTVAESAQRFLDQMLAAVSTDDGRMSKPPPTVSAEEPEDKPAKPHARPGSAGAAKPAGGGAGPTGGKPAGAAKPAGGAAKPAPAPAPVGGGFEP